MLALFYRKIKRKKLVILNKYLFVKLCNDIYSVKLLFFTRCDKIKEKEGC